MFLRYDYLTPGFTCNWTIFPSQLVNCLDAGGSLFIITHKDLPLVYNSQSICEGDTRCSCILSVDNKKKPYLCQSMQITGLNTKTFKTGINNLHMLHIMAHQIPKGLMDQYNPSSYLEYSSIDLRTCYLTACRDNPLRTAMPFHPNVDPKGLLFSYTFMEKTTRFSTWGSGPLLCMAGYLTLWKCDKPRWLLTACKESFAS